MNEITTQLINLLTPVVYAAILAAAGVIVELIRRGNNEVKKKTESENAHKYMDMAADAVTQAVAFTAQTFVDNMKAAGTFNKEAQALAFKKAKGEALRILGSSAVEALEEIYGDFDAWLESKIEAEVRADKKTK